MSDHEVRDGTRVIRFSGVLLGSASSERAASPRWTDKKLYRTEAGSYVLAQVGQTRVIHEPGCSAIMARLNRFVDEHPNAEPVEPRWTFHTCVGETYDLDKILVERTRYGAFITDSPDDIVHNLYKVSGDGRYLPRLSVDLLEEASKHDPGIESAY